jgi:hypothetical protein
MKRKPLHHLGPAILGMACACALGTSTNAHAQRVPIGTNQIAFADFDNFVPSGSYGYWYSGPTDVSAGAPQYFDRYYYDLALDFTNGPTMGKFTFDSTQFQGTDAVLTGWWGCGFGGSVNWTTNVDGVSSPDPTLFSSQDTTDYILTFDARVEGLVPNQTTANCDMEFRLGKNGGGGANWVLVKQIRYHPGTNWVHFRFTLEDGTWIGADQTPSTSFDTFTNAVAAGEINAIAFNQNQPNPDQLGFDADNAFYIDNIKLEVFTYSSPPPPPPPKVALAVLDYNFDDKNIWWIWPQGPAATTGGWSANANLATYWGLWPLAGEGVNGSQALAIAMDNTTILTDPPGRPNWAGGNVSAGGPGNYAQMASSDLKDYRVNLQARAVGLADDQGSTPFIFQMYFNAPDGTLGGATNGNADTLLRLNATINNVKTNWQTFMVSLKDASVDSGSVADFQTYLSQISEISFQLQIQNPHDDTVWGLDANNMIIVDNVKLERLVTGNPALQIQVIGNEAVVTWDPPSNGTAKLLSGSSPGSIDTEVVGATSPHTNAISGTPKYFRTQWVPPQ